MSVKKFVCCQKKVELIRATMRLSPNVAVASLLTAKITFDDRRFVGW